MPHCWAWEWVSPLCDACNNTVPNRILRVDPSVVKDIMRLCLWGRREQVTVWNVRLETRRQFCASCKTFSWSPCQSPTLLHFGQITANHRAPCLWSVTLQQCQIWTQWVIQAWFWPLPSLPPPPHWSPFRHLAPILQKSMILCLDLRNYWVLQTRQRIAPGTFLGMSQIHLVGLWTEALPCVNFAENMWAVEEDLLTSKTIYSISTTLKRATPPRTEQ